MTKQTTHFSSARYQVQDSPGYLLGRARLKLAKSLDLELATLGITHQQGAILMMVAGGQCQAAADLSREMYIDSASMTRMVDRLEKRGLMQRVPNEHDRRVVNLRLTEEGSTLAADLPKTYVQVLNRHFAHFTREETETLKHLLRKMLQEGEE
jgi:DNA-binding MarR family transcriptional regulator